VIQKKSRHDQPILSVPHRRNRAPLGSARFQRGKVPLLILGRDLAKSRARSRSKQLDERRDARARPISANRAISSKIKVADYTIPIGQRDKQQATAIRLEKYLVAKRRRVSLRRLRFTWCKAGSVPAARARGSRSAPSEPEAEEQRDGVGLRGGAEEAWQPRRLTACRGGRVGGWVERESGRGGVL
jgi:hypothetical protein